MKPLIYIGVCLGIIAIVFTTVIFTLYPLKYKKHIDIAANTYNVDPVLIASVINAESGFRRNAISSKGAVGLMQVMPPTAEWIAEKINIDIDSKTLEDPHTNILIGTYYLNYLLDKFNDLRTALIAYNAGEGKVVTWLTDGRYSTEANGHSVLTSCPYPSTNRYVEKILNSVNIYKLRF